MARLLFLLGLILLGCSPLKKYAEYKTGWEKEINTLEQLDKQEEYPEDAILFIGSSSIRLWENIHTDMQPYSAIRRGYGGAHFYDLIHFADRLVRPHKAAGIVVFVANDISGSHFDRNPEEVVRLFKFTVREIRKSHPETPVFLIGITPTPSRWKVWEKTKEANTLLEKYCLKGKNLHFIATESAFLTSEGQARPELFKEDMLHLKQVGYDIWKEIIKQKLDEVL